MVKNNDNFVRIVKGFGFIYVLNVICCTQAELRICARLESNGDSFRNGSLVLKDGTVLGNLAEEYLTSDKNWNVPALWTVSPSCELKACSGTYLNGQCTSQFSDDGSLSPETWLSGKCKCTKECACVNESLQHSVCARAYLEPGGCNICDAAYTELSTGSHPAFTIDWQNKVSSFLVRSGCTITVYEDEDNDGESESIVGPEAKTWSGSVGSYECECDDAADQSNSASTQTESSTPLQVDVPEKLDDLVTSLSENNFDHPGLLSALSSMVHGRSSRNVYLLLIGSSGAGKSSAINILLGKPNLTIAGDHQSTTSDILEFRVPLPIPEVGIQNSELRIIDTPGLGDTRGLQNDALFLATLDDYISNHEELKSKIPNLVLIFHTFEDNRFHGEGARFVRMIRGLENIRPRITDESYSNVLFVFSHLCSAGAALERNPLPRLIKFKEAIELYSFFPKPILTAVVENKGADNELVMRNGNFELPNKELYPQNLWIKFDAITKGGQDKIGNALVNTNAIRNQGAQVDYSVTRSTHYLVDSNHNKVPKYLQILNSAAYHVNNSEVSETLAEAYNDMDTSVKDRFPQALENLQRYLNVKNIRSVSDIPKIAKEKLELLSGIEQNEANTYLLETGLKLKAPSFPSNALVGFSFDISKNSLLSVSPFNVESSQLSSIGFLLPTIIRCAKSVHPPAPRQEFKVFDSKQTYFEHISHSLLGEQLSSIANSTEIFSVLTSKLKEGYLVRDIMCEGETNIHCFVVTRLYETFQFDLQPNSSTVQLQADFMSRAESITPFNESSYDSVDEWNTFFNDFGTHVVTSAKGGGRIDMHFSIPTQTPVEAAVENVMKSLEYADNPLESVTQYKESAKSVFAASENVGHTLTFRGGNQAFHVADISKLSLEEAVGIIKNWKQSLQFYPAVFPREILPLGQVVGKYFPSSNQVEISDKIQTAFGRLLTSTLNYVKPTPDPKILEELERQRKENEEKVRQIQLEIRRQEEKRERQRIANEQAQKKREEEARQREIRRKADEAAAAALQRQKERELQEQHEREARRLRLEQEEADRRHREQLLEIEKRRQEQEAYLNWLSRERQRQWDEAQRKRRSCLKMGTKILLADLTEKPVESLQIGDMLLDKDLKPVRLVGISYEFLLSQKFYGFDNQTFFFTDTHLFADKENDEDGSLRFYTTSTASLFEQNPLLKYLNVRQFGDEQERGKRTRILHYDSKIAGQPVRQEITIYQESKIYPIETPIYFLQVESPSGTYFAEGYVCRHEIPPFEHWPNTMSTLFSLFGTTAFETVAQMPYSLETIDKIDKISDDVTNAVLEVLEIEFLNNDKQKVYDCKEKSLGDFDLDQVLGQMFGNPTMTALGMEIYGGSGSVISKYLDESNTNLTNCRIGELQNKLITTITRQIELSLSNCNT